MRKLPACGNNRKRTRAASCLAPQSYRSPDATLTKHLLAAAAQEPGGIVPKCIAYEFAKPANVSRRLYHIVYIGRNRPTISKRFESEAQARDLVDVAESCDWCALLQTVELYPDEKNPPAGCGQCGAAWDDQTDPETGWCSVCMEVDLDAARNMGLVL
jgi:hypothetical protein